MSKRSRDSFDIAAATSTPGPPAKRLQRDLRGSSPFSSRSSASSSSTPLSLRTPRTPFSIPSDSPSNPFGLKKSLFALDLPKASSYGKHVVLRFQYVREKAATDTTRSRTPKKAPIIYRVAQVPTNYSFRHLHKLIFFLFATDSSQHHSMRDPTPRAAKGKAIAVSRAMSLGRTPSTSKRKATAGTSTNPVSTQSESWRGHVFEVYKASKEHALVSGEEETKGVVLPTGKLWKKLSSVRERHIFRDLYDVLDTAGSKADDGDDDDEEEGWTWEAEDDFLLSHLWPKGPTLQHAIIYRHNPHISIHIAVHRGTVPPRKGIGNLPFVFYSHGSAGDTIRISHDARNLRHTTEAGDLEDDDGVHMRPSSAATPKTEISHWNAIGAFARFLKGEDNRERRLRGLPPQNVDSADTSSEGSVPPSDDIPFPSSDVDADSDSDYYSDSVLFPFASSAITPFPAHPAHRKRVQSAERRLEKLTKSGMSGSRLSDEEDEVPKKKKAEKKLGADLNGLVEGSESPEDFNPFADLVNDEFEV
ncbi:hypothetical protein EIP91_010910 [Steccherinum ochraceum]|uniref:Uncharacterized protein n=1 Tax=Steccherinum ochraceum TaxID=92696 RepID=A0A4R0RJ34_9APHY|nr:hypothetical protein EIP91_010910 [Steccherinum ochraceum]